jgi:radical SAM superfamily enzyme YgiQ (UPF0313 family)
MKVFLGDLVHTWGKIGVWTMPINVGFVAGYARTQVDEPLEIRLFKRPERMIEAIRAERPDVVGLSHYVWNTNLNALVAEIAREANPGALILGGGPIFTTLNSTPDLARPFFQSSPHMDAFVLNQGERGFAALLRRFLELGGDVARLRAEPVAGCLTNDLGGSGRIHLGEKLAALDELDVIPSPYLSGMLDEFFDEPISPIIETNRSCPYRCTFCAWGIANEKLARFSEERVLAEIDYIAQRSRNSSSLFVGDANFGILDRDAGFAAKLLDCSRAKGWPLRVNAQWNKTRPDRVFNAVRALGGLSQVGASMQSLYPATLKAIERKNLPIEEVITLNRRLAEEGVQGNMFSELIVGLPEETRQTHIDANKTLMDLGAEVFNYNLHLLPGTKMETAETRATYFRRTGWRLHDNAYGLYDGRMVFEGQEIVLATSTTSFEEMSEFRYLHFLLQMMWGRGYFRDVMQLVRQELGLHPVDFALALAAAWPKGDSALARMKADFEADQDTERFASFAELEAYWSQPDNFEKLKDSSYGKLNYVYTARLLMYCAEAFGRLLAEVFKAGTEGRPDARAMIARFEDALRFTEARRIHIDLDGFAETGEIEAGHDVLAWRRDGYARPVADYARPVRYKLFLADTQREALRSRFEQFRCDNLNLMLRKMSEYASPDMFFYQVEDAGK